MGSPARRLSARRWSTGTLDGRSFTHRQQRGGCPDADGWLAVNALVMPVTAPEQKATDPADS